MREIVWRVKKGWVYLLGIFLICGFCFLALQEGSINAAEEQGDTQGEGSSITSATNSERTAREDTTKSAVSSPQTNASKKEQKTKVEANTPQASQPYPVSTPEQSSQVPVAGTQVHEDSVTMAITNLGVYTVKVKKGDNAFDVLKSAATEYGFSLSYKDYSWGIMITRIGATEAQNTYYWALYYNGGYSSVGASDLFVKNGDKIEWRYESWM